MRAQATVVKPAKLPQDTCDDPDDLPVLGTVLAGAAVCLVTGDQALLSMGRFGGKPILSPRGLHELILCCRPASSFC